MERFRRKPLDIQAPLAWGYVWPDSGELVKGARPDRPRKTGKSRYNDAIVAVGARAVRVRIVRDRDYQELLRRALSRQRR